MWLRTNHGAKQHKNGWVVHKSTSNLELAPWTLFSRLKCLLKGPPQVSLPKMTFVKNLLITWCPEPCSDNSRLFSTWWMRSPLCPLNRVCSRLRERKFSPCPFSVLLSHGNDCSGTDKHTDTHTVKWEQVKAAVHKGEGWPVRTLSAKLWAPIHH